MLALMLDPCYKSIQVVENYVGCGNVIYLASKDDLKEVIPLLMIVFERFNPSIQTKVVASIDELLVEEEKNSTCLVLGNYGIIFTDIDYWGIVFISKVGHTSINVFKSTCLVEDP
jgi:hypothetical protein